MADRAFTPLTKGERAAAPKAARKDEPEIQAQPFPGTDDEASKAILALHAKHGRPKAVFRYRDRQGQLLGAILRFDRDGGKFFLPAFFGASDGGKPSWLDRMPSNNRPLFHLPHLSGSPPAVLVVVHEGEACAKVAAKALPEFTHIASMAGANSAHKTDWKPVLGRDIVIFPDGNEPGRQYRDDVGKLCDQAGARTISNVLPQDSTEQWDFAWALDNGWRPEQLRKLIIEARPLAELQRQEAKAESPFKVVNLGDFLALQLPERELLLDPIIPRQGLVMVYAPRGLGKTLVALCIAYAVATGSGALGWTAPKPRRVLYLDGEMPARVMQERIAMIAKGAGGKIDPDFFRLITPDLQEHFAVPSLAEPETQQHLAPFLEGVDLIVIDNISTLCEHGRENEGESWKPLQDWALRQRREGRSVLFIHHAGKGGQQRGTSKREDILDTVIVLRRPSDYRMDEGARFEVHLEKARGIVGEAANPFEARLEIVDNAATWALKDLVNEHYSRVVEMANLGMSVRDIADEIGLSKSQVQRYRKQADEAGDLEESKKKGQKSHAGS